MIGEKPICFSWQQTSARPASTIHVRGCVVGEQIHTAVACREFFWLRKLSHWAPHKLHSLMSREQRSTDLQALTHSIQPVWEKAVLPRIAGAASAPGLMRWNAPGVAASATQLLLALPHSPAPMATLEHELCCWTGHLLTTSCMFYKKLTTSC